MHRIITISREFGSGGRELGKRLAEALGIAYFDKEIIKAVAEHSGLAEQYVESISEKSVSFYYPISYNTTFAGIQPLVGEHTDVIAKQNEIIREMAEKSDAVFIGRAADIVLEDYKPLRIFVYADMDSKVARCLARESDAEDYTPKEMEKQIKKIDKGRANFREMITGNKFGSKDDYDLMINTSGLDIAKLIPAVVAYADCYFDAQKK
ncbi:MAG: cytidylate kinase-like family protein [Solobacterium sp.]|nr:cytidylate kinase-like family protein [Solobacterium sp.]